MWPLTSRSPLWSYAESSGGLVFVLFWGRNSDFIQKVGHLRRWQIGDGSDSKESACIEGGLGSVSGLDPLVGKNPWRMERQCTPVFLPGESHGQRSLVGYSLHDGKKSDMTEWLSLALRVLEYHLIRVWMQVSLMVQRGRGGKEVKLEGLLNTVPGPYPQSFWFSRSGV